MLKNGDKMKYQIYKMFRHHGNLQDVENIERIVIELQNMQNLLNYTNDKRIKKYINKNIENKQFELLYLVDNIGLSDDIFFENLLNLIYEVK